MDLGTTMALASQSTSNAQVSEEEMIPYIVEQLHQILGKSYSLVDFDALPPEKLIGLLAEIFESLTTVDFQLSQGTGLLQEFLTRTIGYKVPPMLQHSFTQSFAQGEKSTMYPVLYWVLKHMPQNKKRVYLARFLTRVDVPDDLKVQDEGVRELYQHYENLRRDFIETHKRVDALKDAHADPGEARRKIAVLESEKERLVGYIHAAQKKLASIPNKDALISACKALRVEQEEASRLAEKRTEQTQMLFTAERRNNEASRRLKNVQRDLHEPRLDGILQRLRDETSTNKMKLEEQFPKELNERRAENAAFQRLLTEPVDFQALHTELGRLDVEIRDLEAKVQERKKVGDDGNSIEMIRQQVRLVGKKKEESIAELNALGTEQERYLSELRQQEEKLERLRGSKVLKGEDFRKYSNNVRLKTSATKSMKTRLADLRSEWGTLTYTKKTLQDDMDSLKSEIESVEARLGITGYSERAEQLMRLTEQRNTVEQAKGRTLEELSRIVKEFVMNIRERRHRLAPQVDQLRQQQQRANEVEAEWEEKKQQYELQESLLMQEVTKIETDVASLEDETKLNESLYHRLNCQLLLVNAMQQRVAEEQACRRGEKVLPSGDRSYVSWMNRLADDVDARGKDLQRRRRNIDENHEANVQQVDYFTALRRILEVKAASMKAQGVAGGPGEGLDREIAQAMGGVRPAAGGQGVDMLVFNN